MAEKIFKVNEEIEIVYQAPNAESGLSNITVEIYLPGNIQDSNFPDMTLTEIDSTGEYTGAFTPDGEGEWKAIIHKPGGDGQVVKRYSVGAHNVHSVGEKANSIQTKVDTIDTEVGILDGKVDDLDTKVSSLDTPPMVS